MRGIWGVVGLLGALAWADAVVDTVNVRRPTVHLALGMSVPILNGEVGVGAHAGVAREIEPGYPLFYGLDMGTHRWKAGEHSLRLLPTFYYHFLFPMMPAAIPFVGFSAGPHLYWEGTRGESAITIFPEITFRTGIHLIASETAGITLEPRVGILRSQFFFVPQVSLLWSI